MSRKNLLIALVLSLALNLFIAGLLVGAVAIGRRGPPQRMMMGGSGPVAAAWRSLPPEHRAAFRATFPDTLRASNERLREARRLRRSAIERLQAEPADAAAVIAALERARTIENEARAQIDTKVVSFAANLPAAERASFARAMLARRGGSGRGPGRPGDDGRPRGDRDGVALPER